MRLRMPLTVWVLAWVLACSEKPAASSSGSLRSLAPQPLAPLAGASGDGGSTLGDREEAFQLAPAPVFGEEPPARAVRMSLDGRRARLGEEDFALDSREAMQRLRVKAKGAEVIVEARDDVFLAQAAPALEALDEADALVWLQHPSEARVVFPVLLRDEPSFQAWLDEPKLGKVRAIQRADGFELMTKIGKLPGADPNGPTVPVRGGKMDVATLRRGLGRLEERFSRADDACLVPSFGTEVQATARALTGFWSAPGEPIFSQVCLVYPRPVAPRSDGGR